MSVVDDVKARLDIVDVVSDHVALRKAGRNFKALCPFHTEKTPSFVVNPERQSWYCFGACATGGNAFDFVMRFEKLEFGEALRLLAQRTGVELRPSREGDAGDDLHRLNLEAARFYQKILDSPEGKLGMEYLAERGVDASARSAFQLGLSPKGNRLKGHLATSGFSVEQAVKAGLLRRSDNGEVRDFFWGRLMFPIQDRQGRVAGFGARSLDGSEPKYLNTAATPVFDKQSILYGLAMAQKSIRELGTVVIVEGYMDTIAAHQFGFANVVASMGTALTERQVSVLKSAASDFVLALDPDAAGIQATLRSLGQSWKAMELQQVGGRRGSARGLYQREPLSLRVASLPPGRDPDQLIREEQKEWEQLTRDAVPYMDFAVEALPPTYDLSTDHGKAEAAEALLPLITTSRNAFEQERHFRKLAGVLNVSVEALEATIGRPVRRATTVSGRSARRSAAPQVNPSALASERRDLLEEYVLAILLTRPELRDKAADLAPEQFRKSENREVFTRWRSCTTINELQSQLDESLHDHLAALIDEEPGRTNRALPEAALDQTLRRLEQRHLQELQEAMLASDDSVMPPPRELEDAIVGLNTRLKELHTQPR